jgi:hypothetical protein
MHQLCSTFHERRFFFFLSVFVILQGENLVTAVLTGPGIVFIQSLPFHRLSQRIARYCHLPAKIQLHQLITLVLRFSPPISFDSVLNQIVIWLTELLHPRT